MGTASFLIYVADASGYGVTVALYIGRLFGLKGISWTQLTWTTGWGLALLAPVLLGAAWVSLARLRRR